MSVTFMAWIRWYAVTSSAERRKLVEWTIGVRGPYSVLTARLSANARAARVWINSSERIRGNELPRPRECQSAQPMAAMAATAAGQGVLSTTDGQTLPV